MFYRKLLEKQYLRMKERGWKKLYFVVDVHEVILKPNYDTDYSTEYYPLAKEVLQMLSKREEIVLIMWTASIEEHRIKYQKEFEKEGINFQYINENPEVINTDWGDYKSKMYCNVGFDDKFGFDPSIHWEEIKYFYSYKNIDCDGIVIKSTIPDPSSIPSLCKWLDIANISIEITETLNGFKYDIVCRDSNVPIYYTSNYGTIKINKHFAQEYHINVNSCLESFKQEFRNKILLIPIKNKNEKSTRQKILNWFIKPQQEYRHVAVPNFDFDRSQIKFTIRS